MLLKKIAKQLLFISKMPRLCAILQLVSAPLNPVILLKWLLFAFKTAKKNININALYLSFKSQQYFIRTVIFSLEKQSLLKFLLNPGLNLTHFWTTQPRWFYWLVYHFDKGSTTHTRVTVVSQIDLQDSLQSMLEGTFKSGKC